MTTGGLITVTFGFAVGLLSYNKTSFEKFDAKYCVKTYIFLFSKYETVKYIKEN